MSIATEITRLQTAKANLKTSIEAKGVAVSSEATLDDYPALVDDIPSGGGSPVEEKTVNFYDFDGTLVASYTGEEAQALTALPNAPDHTQDTPSLTFDEWNWTLTEIKDYNTNYPEATINVGANYHTTDGKVHLFYEIQQGDLTGVKLTSSSSKTVDWGDNSEAETSSTTMYHVYQQPGIYHCVLETQAPYGIMYGDNYSNSPYSSKLIKAFFPSSLTTLSGNGFMRSYNLKTISIPNTFNITSIYTFDYCYSLAFIVIPRGSSENKKRVYKLKDCKGLRISLPSSNVSFESISTFVSNYNLNTITIPIGITSIGTETFSGCAGLKKIILPETITTIKQYAFSSCYSIQKIILPPGLTTIENSAFSSCYGLSQIISKAISPPTIGSSTFPSGDILKHIYVPAESVETYKAAGNWDAFASIIEAIPS